MTWQLEPNALEALRDQLIERGGQRERSLLQRPAFSENAAPFDELESSATVAPEVDTLLRRISPFRERLYLLMVADGKGDERERQLLRGVTQAFGGAELSNVAVERLLAHFDANLEQE